LLGNKDINELELRKNSNILIKEWVTKKFNLSAETVIMVTEINCFEPNCPDKETVIALLEQGNIQKFSIRKPLLYVRKSDIDNLKK